MITSRLITGYRPLESRTFADGRAVRDIVMELNPVTGVWDRPVVCLVDDVPVLRRDWGAPLRPGAVVDFLVLPMGGEGGSNPLQLLATLVVILVAGWVGGWVAGFFGGNTIVKGLVSAAIIAGGGALMGAIFKTPVQPTGHLGPAQAEAASPTYGINAANNQARLYQPVGEGFGRIKIIPDRAAQAYSVYIGNEMWLYQVFALGRGSYEIESLQFGDTVFWRDGRLVSGYDVEVQHLEAGEPVTLFPDNVEVSVEVAGQQLYSTGNPEYTGPVGPFSCNPPGTVTSQIYCNLVFPQGIGAYDDQGALTWLSLNILFEVRRVDDFDNPLDDWAVGIRTTMSDATLTAQRTTVEIRTIEGRWQLRASRTDGYGNDSRVLQMCQWESMYSLLPGTLTYNQSIIALKTKATNELSQQAASSFGVTYTRILPEYYPRSQYWTPPRPTRSFAAAMSSVLRCPWGGNLPDSRIDLESLWGVVDPILESKGWTFDGYFDGAYNVFGLILEMSQAFRVIPRLTNGGMGFIFDQPGRPVRHIFTTRDICRGSLSVVYNTHTDDTPDNIVWNYLDEEAGFQQREVRAQLPGSETLNPVVKSFIGCVNREQAFRMGVFACACNRHRRIQVKFQVGGMGRLVGIGDVCAVEHPYFSNIGHGEVKDWDREALAIDTGLELTGLNLDPLRIYYLAINKPDGRPWGPCKVALMDGTTITLDEADYKVLIAQGLGDPFDFMAGRDAGLPVVWTLHLSRAYSGRLVIQSVSHAGGFKFDITAINDSDDVDNYDHLPVPPWNYRGKDLAPGELLTAPTGFSVVLVGTGEVPVMRMTWLPVLGAQGYEIQIKGPEDADYGEAARTTVNFIERPLAPGENAVRVRAVRSGSMSGPWGAYELDTAKSFVPPVSLVVTSYVAGDLKLSWSLPAYPGLTVLRADHYDLELADIDGRVRRAVALTGADTGYDYLKGMALADGAIKRKVRVTLTARLAVSDGKGGESEILASPAVVVAEDEAPVIETQGMSLTIGADGVTLGALEVEGEHTGFVVVRGDSADFEYQGVVEMRTPATLPWTWTGLSPDTDYWFRIAARDALADLTANYADLAWSGVVAIHTETGA